MLGSPKGLHASAGIAAARSLARRRRRRPQLEPLDVLAHLVSTLIIGTLAVSAARASAGIEAAAGAAASERLAVLVAGVVVVAATLAAVASGRRGGPLAMATPLVVLVMLAPVDRGSVLRIPAIRQVVAAGVAGALTGGALWIVLAGSVPRASPAWWLSAGGAVGVSCAGVALLGAGLRVSGRASVLVQLAIAGWWSVDAALDTATSPLAVIARMPFTGVRPFAGIASVGIAIAVAALGVHRIGGFSVERAWRRSGAADQLRVALGLNDLRTALLILRRRAIESPRRRPWRTLAGRWSAGHPIATRSVRALLRWPLSRIGRFVSLAAACGVLVAGAGHALALAIVAVVLAFAAALDAVDALSEELDHPDLQRGYPIAAERLALHHLTVPLFVMTVFCSFASGVAGLIVGADVALTGLAASPLVALAAVAGAGLTATRTARPFTEVTDIALPAEVVAPRIVLRVAAPVLPLALMVLPMVETHDAGRLGTLASALPGAALSLALLGFVLFRARLDHLRTLLVLRLRRLGAG